MASKDSALSAMSSVVAKLMASVKGDWTQRVDPSAGPCSAGGIQRGLEWADDWDGAGFHGLEQALDSGEHVLRDAGFEVRRSEDASGGSIFGVSADGRSVLLDIGANGRALIAARSACFPDPDAGA